jgi:cellulose synthase operon protein C
LGNPRRFGSQKALGLVGARMANLHKILFALVLAVGAAPVYAQQAGDAEAALRNAQQLFSNSKWIEAVRAFDDFQRQYPQHPQAANAPFSIAEAQVQLGEYEKARELLGEFIAETKDDERRALALFRVGECSFFLNQYDRARKDLELFRSQNPIHEKDSYAIGYLGDIYLAPVDTDVAAAKKLFQDGLTAYSKKTSKDPAIQKQYKYTAEECRLGLGRAHAAAGEIPQAISLLKKMAEDTSSPLATEGRIRLGKVCFDARRYDEAIGALKPFEKAKKSPSRNWGLYWLGRSYLDRNNQGDAALAVKWLLAIEITDKVVNPDEPPIPAIAYYLGEAYRASGQFDKAVGRYELVAYDYAESDWADDAFLGAMRVALDQQDYRKVTLDYLATASTQFTTSPLFPYMDQLVGQAFLKNEKYADAQSTFSKLTEKHPVGAATVDPDEPDALPVAFTNDNWLFLALAEIGLRRPDDALAALKKITPTKDADSDDFNMAVNAAQANANVLLKKYREAIVPLQDYLKVRGGDPDAPRYYELLARCQIMDKQAAQAERTIDALGKLDPETIGGLEPILKVERSLAVLAAKQNEQKLARHIYTHLTFPKNPPEYIAFGEDGLARLDAGKPPPEVGGVAESEPVNERADEKEAFAHFQEGLYDEEMEDAQKALQNYEKVYTDFATSAEAPKALLAAGRIHDRAQNDAQAAKLLVQLVQDYPGFPQLDLAYYRLAWTLIESQDQKGGEAAFRKLVDHYPDSTLWADAAYRVAEFESAKDRRTESNRLLDDILRQNENAANPTRLLDHVLYLRGQNAFRDRKWTVVEQFMQRLIDETPESPLKLSAKYWLAESAYKSQDWNLAQERFTSLSREADGRSETWLSLIPLRQAQILAWQKHWNDAYQAARQIKRDNPNFDRMHEVDYLLGRCLSQVPRFTDARKAFAEVIARDSGKRGEPAAMAQWMIGETYFRQQDYTKAIDAYDKVREHYNYPYWQSVALLQMGKCYLQLPNEEKRANAAFSELLSRFPESTAAETAAKLRKTASSGSSANRGASGVLR